MPIDHTMMARLAFVKYLFQTAVTQSRAPSPLNCASILLMHDSIELFLQLASEHLNCGTNHPTFMDYWDILNQKLAPKQLEQKESMRRLNKARVALKHHGTFPANLDIDSFRSATASFFEANSPLVFGVAIAEVSLVEFVNPESARNVLKNALTMLSENRLAEAQTLISIAFAEIINGYEGSKRSRFGNSPFHFGRDLTFQSSFFMGLSSGNTQDRKLAEFVDRVKESIDAIQSAIKMLALGLDYRKYSRFQILTPRVMRSANGFSVSPNSNHTAPATPHDVQFCVDFVIESSLVLSEFDYSIEG
jgi:hypothetical protein